MKKLLVLSFLMIPALAGGNEVIYLDYAASYAASRGALEEFVKVAQLDGNSSGLNVHAKHLKEIEERAAKIVAGKINAKPDQIHFCSSATTANNIAILGVAQGNPGCHLITSKIEHKSVLNVFKHLETRRYKVTYLNVDRHGNVDLEQLRKSIRKNTKLISIQMLNSEIGTLQNVKAIGEIARQHKILFHTDAAQAFCKYDIDIEALHIDLLTMAGHKIGSPKGIGALYIRDPSRLQPILFGSGDEFFPGSKATELIAAFAAAVQNFKFDTAKIARNFNVLTTELTKIGNIHINSSSPSHIVSVSIAGVLLTDIMERLKEYSFAAGCSCTGQERSNVMAAIDPEDKLPSCTLRISFFDSLELHQLITFAQRLKTVVDQLRREKSVAKGCESIDTVKQKDLGDSLNKIQELLEKGK
ncbi:MAG: aminotransferase class V-fold PLP-dependent enzyme [Holosporaceae bacterium]|jgi:cysteine desulfurase|nr:aminotransferase class V-fold PLP-dependent enzyme [Holosporaceae bacterium]